MRSIVVLITILAGSVLAFGQNQPATVSGIEAYRSGEFAKAIEILQKAVTDDKDDKFAWAYLGAAHLKLNDKKNAIRALKRSNLTYLDKFEALDTPLRIINKPRAYYTDNARGSSVTGEIRLAVEFKADGTFGFIFPFKTLPEGLTENAIRAARSITFDPGIRDGKPVDAVMVISYKFDIY